MNYLLGPMVLAAFVLLLAGLVLPSRAYFGRQWQGHVGVGANEWLFGWLACSVVLAAVLVGATALKLLGLG